MSNSITDQGIRIIVEYGFFANNTEYHSFVVGVLCGILCIFIYSLDKKIAAFTLSGCTFIGLGVFPEINFVYVIEEKSWYFLAGLTIQFGTSYLLIHLAKWSNVFGIIRSLGQIMERD